jgi:hypothetical protein
MTIAQYVMLGKPRLYQTQEYASSVAQARFHKTAKHGVVSAILASSQHQMGLRARVARLGLPRHTLECALRVVKGKSRSKALRDVKFARQEKNKQRTEQCACSAKRDKQLSLGDALRATVAGSPRMVKAAVKCALRENSQQPTEVCASNVLLTALHPLANAGLALQDKCQWTMR